MQIMKYVMKYGCNVYMMEKSYSETEQNMSEKQGKGQIMLHLPMKFENHAMNRENEFIRSWSG